MSVPFLTVQFIGGDTVILVLDFSMLKNLTFVYSLKIYRFIQKLDSRVKKLKINRWDYFVRIINSIFQSGQLRIIKKSPQKSFHRHFILGEKRVKIGLTKMEK